MRVVAAMCAVLVWAGMAACKEKIARELTPTEIKAKTDSIVASRTEELRRAAIEDLDRRSSIEVKGKTDSIVNAYLQNLPKTQPDTQAVNK